MSVALPSISKQFNVAEYFVDANLKAGRADCPSIFFGEQVLRYGQVADEVNRAANLLGQAGVEIEERVALLLLDSPAFVAAFWGAIKLGAVAVPLNTLLTREEYGFMLRDSQARALIVDSSLVDKVEGLAGDLPHLKTVLVAGGAKPGYESFDERLAQSSPEFSPAATHRDDPAFWLYTSGSTGPPKAAIHLQHDMVCCLESYAKPILQISSRDRTFSASKLFFAYGLGNALYFPFGVGASTVLLPERATAEKVFQVIGRYRPTIFYGVPTLYAAMLQVPEAERKYDLSSVRCVVSAGEALPAPLWEKARDRWGWELLDGIGSTELLHIFISNRPGEVKPGSSGTLVPGYEAKITDEQGREVREGEMGNLWIRGDSAAAGYWNRRERSRTTFVGEWTLTGDKYTRDENAFFWYGGRSDDMLKVSGLWVSPVEIESALLAHPAVVECAVVGANDADGLTKPKAFVMAKPSTAPPDPLETELREFLKGKLAGYKVPRWIVFAETLPKTATGKIQRFKLRKGI